MQAQYEDEPESQRLHGVEQKVVHQGLPWLPHHEADPPPEVLQIKHHDPRGDGEQSDPERVLPGGEEDRTHSRDDARGHCTE